MARSSTSHNSSRRPSSAGGTNNAVIPAPTDTRWFGYKDIATLCARTMEERFPLPAAESDQIDDSASDTLIELSSSGHGNDSDEEDAGLMFAEWVAYILYRTVLPMTTVFHALHLVLRVSAAGKQLPATLDPPPGMPNMTGLPAKRNQTHYRLFLAALVLCTTYSMDDAYALKSWAIASRFAFDIKTINRMEFDLFRALEWRLAAEGEVVPEIVQRYESEWQAGLKQAARLKADRERERTREFLRRLPSIDGSGSGVTPQPSPASIASTPGPKPIPIPASPASRPSTAPRRSSSRESAGPRPAPAPRRSSSRESAPRPAPAPRRSSSRESVTEAVRPDSRQSLQRGRTDSRAPDRRPPTSMSTQGGRRRSLSTGIRNAVGSLFRTSSSRENSRERGQDGLPREKRGGIFRSSSRESFRSDYTAREGASSRQSLQRNASSTDTLPQQQQQEREGKPAVLTRQPSLSQRERRPSNEARWLGFQIGSAAGGRRPLPRPPTAAAAPPAVVPVENKPRASADSAQPTATATGHHGASQWRRVKSKPPISLRRMSSQPSMQTRPLAAAA